MTVQHYYRCFSRGRHFGFVYAKDETEAAEKVRDMNPHKPRDWFRVKLERMAGSPGYVDPRK